MTDHVTIYSPTAGPLAERLLERISSGCELHAEGDDIQLVWPDLVVSLNLLLAGEQLSEHLGGFCGYAEAAGDDGEVTARIEATQMAIGIVIEPGFDDDDRAEQVVDALVESLGGLIFLPDGCIYDEQMALLLEAPEGEEEACEPPTPTRVAQRALVLAAVSARGIVELDRPENGPMLCRRFLAWLEEHGADQELEPAEREVLAAEFGTIEEQAVIDAAWRSEGMTVLAWALGRAELPTHDQVCDPGAVSAALGFLQPEIPEILGAPDLRGQEEIEWQAGRLLGLHWRLRDYSLRPESVDFRAFAGDCWFGSFDLSGIQLADDDDLAIEGQPITAAEPEAIGRTRSIAMERHQAINWLMGWEPVYSEVDTST